MTRLVLSLLLKNWWAIYKEYFQEGSISNTDWFMRFLKKKKWSESFLCGLTMRVFEGLAASRVLKGLSVKKPLPERADGFFFGYGAVDVYRRLDANLPMARKRTAMARISRLP